jgi:hypothetical protein
VPDLCQVSILVPRRNTERLSLQLVYWLGGWMEHIKWPLD